MPTLVYHASQIQSWRTEQLQLGQQIPEFSKQWSEHNSELIPLRDKLQILASQISSVEAQIHLAEWRNADDRAYHWQQNPYNHHYHHHSRPGLWHMVGDGIAAYNTASLYSELNRLTAERATKIHTMQRHIDGMESSRAQLDRANARLRWLEQHVQEGNIFLHTLSHNPAQLLTRLKQNLLQAFKKYDDENPANRSVQVRSCLLNSQQKLQCFADDPLQVDNKNLQINYLRLCAFIQDMYFQVHTAGKDQEFSNLLASILEGTHIATNGDLPDSLATGRPASSHFTELQQFNTTLFALSDQNLIQQEQSIFAESMQRLQKRVVYASELQNKINHAVEVIGLEVGKKAKHNQAIDYHFYNRALNDLYQLSFNPQDSHSAQHLGILAVSASGAPSVGKQVAGALAAVFGLLVVAASLACFFATMGGSSLLSGLGVAMGLSLLQSVIVVNVGLSLTAMAGTALSFWGSSKLNEGIRHGVSKELECVKDEALQPSLAPI